MLDRFPSPFRSLLPSCLLVPKLSCLPVMLSQGRDGGSHAKICPLLLASRLADAHCFLRAAELICLPCCREPGWVLCSSPAPRCGSEDGQSWCQHPALLGPAQPRCRPDPPAHAAAWGRRVCTGSCCCFRALPFSLHSGKAGGWGFPVSSARWALPAQGGSTACSRCRVWMLWEASSVG